MSHRHELTAADILPWAEYAKDRAEHRRRITALKRHRRIEVGPYVTFYFESFETMWLQVQEMLHIEKIFEEEGIQSEIEAYAPLVPDGTNWKATMLIEYPDPHERKRELARLIGVEDRMFVEVEGHARVYAIADEDLDRENEEKTSSVHFVRFEFPQATREAVRAGASVKLGCDHTHYPYHCDIAAGTLSSLAGDLK